MDFIQILKEDLGNGYSKSDLEKLIGLPQNCLSGIIKGDKKLSRKSELKIGKWEASEKPNPLQLFFVKKEIKVTDLATSSKVVEPQKPLGSPKTNITINTKRSPPKLVGESSIDYRLRMLENDK